MINLAILASHNGSNLDAINEAIQTNKLDAKISVIISNNNDANVLKKAKELSIDSFVVNQKTASVPDEKIAEILETYQCDCVVLSGYMKKLSTQITESFKIINSHPALLPKYGGSGMYGRFVHEAVIANKESKSGVSIHFVNEHYDEGEIILQKELVLSQDETVESLERKIKELEKQAVVEALEICLK
ncbi:phosphoribosylglycinamide formyltransferase [Sulfurimonas sp. C5]|uniref:phosphoribosylglycinamide formyltransferase n=1 Tax=Sulfurimonas sp. C5 TaxID=3036947 RepID=UPI002455BE98|nr:phosphoribosylglycinamide formyltransferase [Sulfurimonas sp. C5]MDH4945016.1 phosphoribosylglycinamide formyltransferase [Sulfurimonas sp. C5]